MHTHGRVFLGVHSGAADFMHVRERERMFAMDSLLNQSVPRFGKSPTMLESWAALGECVQNVLVGADVS